MSKYKSLLLTLPCEFAARHMYCPCVCFDILCSTRDWLVMMIPRDECNGLLLWYHSIFFIGGFASIRHSKYTSVPFAKFFGSKLDPSESVTMGASGRRKLKNCSIIENETSKLILTFDVQCSYVFKRHRWCIRFLFNRHQTCNDFAIVFGCGQVDDIWCCDITVGGGLWMKSIESYWQCEIGREDNLCGTYGWSRNFFWGMWWNGHHDQLVHKVIMWRNCQNVVKNQNLVNMTVCGEIVIFGEKWWKWQHTVEWWNQIEIEKFKKTSSKRQTENSKCSQTRCHPLNLKLILFISLNSYRLGRSLHDLRSLGPHNLGSGSSTSCWAW